jgi:hypothetical protein
MSDACLANANKYISELFPDTTTSEAPPEPIKEIDRCLDANPKTPELGSPRDFVLYKTACGILGDASGKRDAPYQ